MGSWIRARRRFFAALLIFALIGVAVTGCAINGGESNPSQPSIDAGYDSTAKPPRQSPNDIRQQTGLGDERVSSWSRYEVISDTSVRIFFYMGNPECHGVRATVDEDEATVRITLYEGTLSNAPTECVANAVSASLLLTTRNPIGKRSIVTG